MSQNRPLQFKLRTLLIVLGIGPPILAGLLYAISSTWRYWPIILAFWPLCIPFVLLHLLFEAGVILQWLFADQIAADKARVNRAREERQKKRNLGKPNI